MGETIAASLFEVAVRAMQRGQMVRLVLNDDQVDSDDLDDQIGYITGIRKNKLTFTNVMNSSRFVSFSGIREIEMIMK